MTRLDELAPDLRAALSLLLSQRKDYAEVGSLLGVPPQAIHDRAHAALTLLAPAQARALDPSQREEIGEYLLGQQGDVGERLRTRTLLSSSDPARSWANALAGELAPMAAGGLPEIPAAADEGGAGAGSRGDGAPESPAAAGAFAPAHASGPPSSRRAGALLLAAIVAAVVVAVVLLSSGGGSHKKTTSTGAAAAKAGAQPKAEGRIALVPGSPSSRGSGTVEILSEGGKRAFFIQAEHLPASKGFFYAIWLYNSPTSALALSKAPTVGADGKLAGAALLPSNASSYRELLVTRETNSRPSRPGPIVLRGRLQLKG
jgi:hypothetical protein